MSKADKSDIDFSEKLLYFFTSDEYDLHFFTIANRGCLDNLGVYFFQNKIWNARYLSDITLRMYTRQKSK